MFEIDHPHVHRAICKNCIVLQNTFFLHSYQKTREIEEKKGATLVHRIYVALDINLCLVHVPAMDKLADTHPVYFHVTFLQRSVSTACTSMPFITRDR